MAQWRRFIVILITLLSSIDILACTADYYSLPAGTYQDINECGTCRFVTNNGTQRLLVPTRTNPEWTAFYTNVTANSGGDVTIGTCGTTCTYPLDTIATPVAAYSLRKLRTAYSGPLIRIRRSSDNAQTDIGVSGVGCGNLDTSAITSFVGGSSAYVVTWYDQSGNGRHATQSTNGRQPRIVNSGTLETKHGHVTIYFNGSTFIPGVGLGIGSTSGWSYSMVIATTSFNNGGTNDGAGTYFMDRTPATNNLTSFKAVGGKLTLQKRNNSGGGLGGVSTTTNISTTAIQSFYAQRIYNTSYSVYLNNTGENTVAESDGALTPPIPQIGRHTDTSSSYNIGIYELIYWGSALNSGDRTTVYQRQTDGFGF